jgi:hypothetical protein
MDVIILDKIEFNIDLVEMYDKLRLKKNSEYFDRVNEIVEEGVQKARPKAMYRPVKIESRDHDHIFVDDIKLDSKILRIVTADTDMIIPYVATCGSEIEHWASSYDDLFDLYVVDLIQEAACRAAVATLFSHLDEKFKLENSSSMSPGSLEDWPIQQQKNLFSLLKNKEKLIGVELLKSQLMKPVKSLSGIRFTSIEKHINCKICPRQNCPTRNCDFDQNKYYEMCRQR